MARGEMTDITKRIRNDWGSVTHFCRKHEFNLNTFRSVVKGFQRSPKITDKLLELGYLKEGEIPVEKNVYDKNKKQNKVA